MEESLPTLPSGSWTTLVLDDGITWLLETPLTITVRNGVVTEVSAETS